MRVAQLTPALEPAYSQFLQGRDDSLFYYTLAYRDFLTALLGCSPCYLAAIEGETVAGVLPLMIAEGPLGRVYNALPYYGSNGGILAATPVAGSALAEAYRHLAEHPETLSATIVENPLLADAAALVPHNLTDHRIGQWTRLLPGDDDAAIMARIDGSARRNVRKALSAGITAKVEFDQLGALRTMHQANMRAIGGRAKSDRFFDLISGHFAPGRDYDLYVARQGGQVAAALLLFYFGCTVEYFTPAIAEDHRADQPLALLILTAMVEAASRNFRWWNWGGTWETQTGVYRFKRKWAAEDKRYHYYTQLNRPEARGWPASRLVADYDGFYVLPFSALEENRMTAAAASDGGKG